MRSREKKVTGLGKAILLACLTSLLAGCGTVVRIETNVGNIPAGAHQLGQAMVVEAVPRIGDAATAKSIRESLDRAGVPAEQAQEGSVVLLRIYCCGGSMKEEMPIAFVPPGLTVALGNIVEFRAADPAKVGTPESLNIAIRVRHERVTEGEPCWWDPPQKGLWMRVLRADWMPAEGWQRQGWLSPAWYKRQD